MKRRILIALAAMLMLTLVCCSGALGTTSDPKTMDVYIYGFSWPTAGESVQANLDALYTPAGAPYSIDEAIYYYHHLTYNVHVPEGQSKFRENTEYLPRIILKITDMGGCDMIRPHIFDRASGREVTEQVIGSFTMGNNNASSITEANPWKPKLISYPYKYLLSYAPPSIQDVRLTGFSWPIAGVTASSNLYGIDIDGFAHCKIKKKEWYTLDSSGNEQATFFNAFVDGRKYRLKVTLQADPHYKFASPIDGAIDGQKGSAAPLSSDNTQAVFTFDAVARNPILINQTNFPNVKFRTFVSNTYDTDKDGVLDWEEYKDVTDMDVSGIGAVSVQGIEYFPALLSLNARNNNIYNIDLSGNTRLIDVILSNNANLHAVDTTMLPNLVILNISGCSLNSPLDLSKNQALKRLSCANTGITSLDISPCRKLVHLDCSHNALTELDVTHQPDLESLHCNSNNLITLDISACTSLRTLECQHNGTDDDMFSAIDISNNPWLLSCAARGTYTQGHDDEGYYDLYTRGSMNIKHTTFSTRLEVGNVPLVIPVFFPDDAFRTYVREQFDKDGNYRLSGAEVAAAKAISLPNDGVTSLKGIEFLTELETLQAPGNALEQVSLEKNTRLRDIDLSNNSLTSLDTWYQTGLQTLNVQGNDLYSLGLSNNMALKTLRCGGNRISQLDLTYCNSLEALEACDAGITWIGLANNVPLFEADLTENNFRSLSIDRCPKMQKIVGYGTREHNEQYHYYKYTGPDGGYLMVDDDVELSGGGLIPMDAAHFPDDNFRAFLREDSGFDVDGDGTLSPMEIIAVDELELCSLGISDLTGLEYFPELTYLNIEDNPCGGELNIRVFPKLRQLYMSETNIDEIIYPGDCDVEEIHCANTGLESLSFLYYWDELERIVLDGQRTPISLSFLYDMIALRSLSVRDCGLTNLDFLENDMYRWLEELDVSENPLGVLDLNREIFSNLEKLTAQSCGLTQVKLWRKMPYLRDVSLTGNPNLKQVYLGVSGHMCNLIKHGKLTETAYSDFYDGADGVHLKVPHNTMVVTLNQEDWYDIMGYYALPFGVTAIEESAFEGVEVSRIFVERYIDEMTGTCLPFNLKRIGKRAFANNSRLKAIHIPPSCTSIASDAFSGCSKVTICGEYDSAAMNYAYAHNLPFAYIRLDD